MDGFFLDPLWMQKDIYITNRSLHIFVPFILDGPFLDLNQWFKIFKSFKYVEISNSLVRFLAFEWNSLRGWLKAMA